MTQKRDLIAQWAFDTRPVLDRFHLWLEDVQVDRTYDDPEETAPFAPRGIRRSLVMTTAITALGTHLFGNYGGAIEADKVTVNRVKKAADAISAYVMSEGLWYLTRNLPENHAIMVCLGEGLMPKAGESPEMGANPMLGFGRVYARPEVARFIDTEVHRLLNEPDRSWADFFSAARERRITIWGAAVDTLENTSRFAKGNDTGPMSIFHLFDQPLAISRPYEAYMGSLTVPHAVRTAAEAQSVLLDFLTPRAKVVEAIEHAYPGINRGNIHVWTLRGASRETRLRRLWDEWNVLGVHIVDDGWEAPTGMTVFNESGTYAPTWMVGDWTDAGGKTHVFLCDGYAATAEAVQAASLSDVLDVDVSMVPFSPKFHLPHDDEYRLMRLDPNTTDFDTQVRKLFGSRQVDDGEVAIYRNAILDAKTCNLPIHKRVLVTDDLFCEKDWHVLATAGHICPDPYTGAPGVEVVHDDTYRITTHIATRRATSLVTLTLRMLEPPETQRLVFSPLLVRFTSGEDFTTRPVKVSDSGRIRNELQTMMPQALSYNGDTVVVHFDRLDDKVIPPDIQDAYRLILTWYKERHPVWFSWLKIK